MTEGAGAAAMAGAAAAKLTIAEVSKRYGEGASAIVALERVSLSLAENDFLCIVGPSGCGKTTLLNIVAGFERATAGEVLMDGVPIGAPDAARGVVFQQGALFTWLSVEENVAFGPRCRGMPRGEARDIASRYLRLVGLEGFAGRYPYELSGGMQQRVGIARALANDPELLLMDEPFAALDAQTREILQEEIKRIWKETGKTILWITHSIDEALFLATDVAVMTARPGRIKARFKSGFGRAESRLVTVSPAFTEMRREVLELLRDEAMRAQAQEAERP
ncbi:MAG: ABC transporter ATP-binding protein [Alphaproteobacteria bacterium]